MAENDIEFTKYYVLFYSRWDYQELQEELAEQKNTETDVYIVSLLEYATAAVYIGALTDNQRTVFNAKIKKNRHFDYCHINTILVPILLIPADAKLLLNLLLNESDWDKTRDIAVKTAEWVRELRYEPSAIETITADNQTIAVIKHNFEDPRKRVTEASVDPDSEAKIIDEYELPVEVFHEISKTQYGGRGWAHLARIVLEKQRKPCGKADVKTEARNIQNRVQAYRQMLKMMGISEE